MTPTIKTVAEHAGVSIATVSRYINGFGSVRPANVERVRKAIEELNFRPNVIGRSLRTAQTRSFGVMIPSLANPVFAEAMAGIQEGAKEAGYTTVITNTDYSIEEEPVAVHAMLSNQVDGLILTVTQADDNLLLDQLDSEQVPYVLLYNQTDKPGRCAVSVDNVAAAREVAERFLLLGHERVCMVTGRIAASDRAEARRRGFLDGLRSGGIDHASVVEVDFVNMDVTEVLHSLFASPAPPTALFCSNDALAIAVIAALRTLGIRVPRDVSIIGFDGISIGELIEPCLTTVEQPSREMGRTAVQHLLDILSGEATRNMVFLPHRLRTGATTGPVSDTAPVVLQNPKHHSQKENKT